MPDVPSALGVQSNLADAGCRAVRTKGRQLLRGEECVDEVVDELARLKADGILDQHIHWIELHLRERRRRRRRHIRRLHPHVHTD